MLGHEREKSTSLGWMRSSVTMVPPLASNAFSNSLGEALAVRGRVVDDGDVLEAELVSDELAGEAALRVVLGDDAVDVREALGGQLRVRRRR